MGRARGKNKQFRDPVHGYISVPAEWCEAFIDTPIFQRLRHIEQTSMRPLYPSARHDRFAHSLGVYHLAKLAFQYLKENTDEGVVDGTTLSRYENSFLVAALMHDCAHACFSHTFEHYYSKKPNPHAENDGAEEFLFECVDENFISDYKKRREVKATTAPHEIFSAAVFKSCYATACKTAAPQTDLQLVARMIIGCVHTAPDTTQQQVENCLIRLINGPAIDVDKLDYILRDTWSSGVDNVSIDTQRLLSALEIAKIPQLERLDVVFRKSALSVLQSVIDARNYLFRWMYSHHTVLYYKRLLADAVESLNKALSPSDQPDAFLDAVFSRNVFERPVCVGPTMVYLPCDDDIYALLKTRAYNDGDDRLKALVEEILGRKPSRVPLWKTETEFELLFEAVETEDRSAIREAVGKRLQPILGDGAAKVLVEKAETKMVGVDESRLWVRFHLLDTDRIESFRVLAQRWHEARSERKNISCFYVYIPRESRDLIPKCVAALIKAPDRV